MRKVTTEYIKAMDSSLRPATRITLELTNKCNEIPNPTVNVLFTGREIESLDFVWDIDPLSRKLPVHNLNFKVFDPNNKYTEGLELEDNRIRVILHIYQTLLNGREYELPDPDVFYVRKIENSGITTLFKCSTIISELTNSKLKEKFLTANTVDNFFSKIEDCVSSNTKDTSRNIPGININIGRPHNYFRYLVGNWENKSCSTALQEVYNSYAFGIVDKFSRSSYQSGNDWAITPVQFKMGGMIPYASRVLKLQDVFKDGIHHSKTPLVGMVEYEDADYEAYGKYVHIGTVEYDGKMENSIVEYDFPYEYYYLKTRISRKTVNADLYFKGLDKVEVQFRGSSPGSVTLEGHLLVNRTSSKKMNVPEVKSANREELTNSQMIRFSAENGNIPYFAYRNNLKLAYRGDPSIEPLDKIFLEYSPGKRVPCLVLYNKISYHGTLKGEIMLKILLTDEEIEKGQGPIKRPDPWPKPDDPDPTPPPDPDSESGGGGDSGGGTDPVPPPPPGE